MALWMTVKQEFLGLAALLLVFSCVFFGGFFERHLDRGKDKGRWLAFLVVFWLSTAVGCGRMEMETWNLQKEQEVLKRYLDTPGHVTGQVTEIQRTDYGLRLVLQKCEIAESGMTRALNPEYEPVGRLYCYLYNTDFPEIDNAESYRLGMWIQVSGTCEPPDQDRNPGGFDYRLYCYSKGIAGTVKADDVESCPERMLRQNRMEQVFWSVREQIRQISLILEQQIDRIAEPEDAGILKAVLLGTKTDLDEDIYELYRLNGISHILAISGLHVSIVGKGLWNILRKLGFGYVGAGVCAFFLLFAYGTMIGFGPSVVRAVFMMGVSFLAGVYGRTYDLPSAMCIPAIGLLMGRPYILTQAGFQLSFLAVGAMFFPGSVLAKKLELKGVILGIFTSLSLQMVTLPVVLFHSFETPLYGVILNFFVVPLMTYVLICGILGVAGSFAWAGLGTICVGGAHYILWLYKSLCMQIIKFPGANQVLGRPEWTEIFVYYICLLAGTWMTVARGRQGKRWLVLWGIGLLVLLPRPENGLSVTFLDVGQGDGIYLESGSKNMLVDCGSSQNRSLGEDVLIPFLKSRGVTRLDTVVVSHGDQDHVSGIEYLLAWENEENRDSSIPMSEIEIGRLILPKSGRQDETCMELERLAVKHGIEVQYCGAGDSLTGCLEEEIAIFCLHPGEEPASDRNENSLILYLQYGNFNMLLTGDAGIETENEILETYDLNHVTVLKAGHHGSNTSTGQKLLEALQPDYVVFSYGEGNSYGHPSAKVLERCENTGAQRYETAKSGAVILWTDGEQMKITEWMKDS